MAKTIPFAEWAPDLSSLGGATSGIISGVLPQIDGYGPFQSLEDFTEALPADCRGYFFARNGDGSVTVFAGTSTNLYKLDNTDLTWDEVSKGGIDYSTLVAGEIWSFAQFNDLVIAAQQTTVPQKFALSSSTEFADLGGSPPAAGHVAVVNRFLVLAAILSQPRRVQWSDLDAPETWTAGVGLSDFQDLPDGGNVYQLSGGDAFGVIFQDESIRSLIYAPGSAVTFQIARIAIGDTLYARYSVVNVGDRTFYISAQGFKMIVGGSPPVQIGKSRVDTTFFKDVDAGSLGLIAATADPTGTRVLWPYKSLSGQANLFDKVLCYDWALGRGGQWSLLPISGQIMCALARPGLTLEGLNPLGTLDTLPFSLDSVSRAAAAQLSGISANRKLGFFSGANIEAILETPEVDLEGSMVFVSGSRPITDSFDALISVGHRTTAQDSVLYTVERPIDRRGFAPARRETRYARARARIPAGSTWTFIRGVQPETQLAGEQ